MIALLTFYTKDWLSVADLTRANKEAYCVRHGYTHVEIVGPYRDGSLYYAVDRLYCVQDLLATHETVLVLNVPSLVTNLTVPLESRLDPEHDFFIGMERDHVNAGCFVIRRSEWSTQWLAFLMEDSPRCGHPWWENQSMINNYRLSPWREQIVTCAPGVIQSYRYDLYPIDTSTPGHWHLGDFILGLPGLDLGRRTQTIKDTLSQVVS